MKAGDIIDGVGGRRAVIALTGLSSGQLSHWIKYNYIASHWIRFFIALKPELDWLDLLQGDTREYTDLLNHEHVIRTRLGRLGKLKQTVNRLTREANELATAGPAEVQANTNT